MESSKIPIQDIEIILNVSSAHENVPKVERAIHVLKEHFHELWHCLSYKAISIIMIKKGVLETARWVNAFPPKSGISTYYRPQQIVTSKTYDCNLHCNYSFGTYCQAWNETEPHNSLKPRTIGCIYLQSLHNMQGGHTLLNLTTGKTVTRHHIIEVPITYEIITYVKNMALCN